MVNQDELYLYDLTHNEDDEPIATTLASFMQDGKNKQLVMKHILTPYYPTTYFCVYDNRGLAGSYNTLTEAVDRYNDI